MSNKDNLEEEFGPIRKLLWPIHNSEMKKFLPLGLIMFCILFNYTVLRDTKDTLVVNSAGASTITFLKLYCVTPAAVLFVILYAKLTNILSREAVFYAVIVPFLVFFGAFGFIIFPNIEALHPSAESLAALIDSYPRMAGFIDIIGYWAYSLFYVLSEIWGSALLALMFWQFANHVVRMREAKRFYGLFVVIGNIALILSGSVVTFCSSTIKNFYPDYTEAMAWGVSIKLLMACVVVVGILAMAIYRWMHTDVLTDKRYFDPAEQVVKKKKEKPSLKESFKILINSPVLGLIAILIMAYGVTINLAEIQWKHQLKLHLGGDRGAYNGFMGQFSLWTGVVTIIFSLFIGSRVLRAFSWFKAAVITPAFIFLSGSIFFCFILSTDLAMLKNLVESALLSLATTPVTAAAFLGAAIVLTSKSIKYSLFDPTKEMAYIPLDDELKTKGKAAVDVIGGRAGKAGGAGVQSLLFMAFATKDVVAIAPYTFLIFAVVCVAWFFAVKMLSVKIDEATDARKVADSKADAAVVGATPAKA